MSICGGLHQSYVWTKKQIKHHMIEDPCIDCYCGIPFKQTGKRKTVEADG